MLVPGEATAFPVNTHQSMRGDMATRTIRGSTTAMTMPPTQWGISKAAGDSRDDISRMANNADYRYVAADTTTSKAGAGCARGRSKQELTAYFAKASASATTLDRPLAAADIPLTHTQGPFDGGREPNAQCMCQDIPRQRSSSDTAALAGYRVVRASGTGWSSR